MPSSSWPRIVVRGTRRLGLKLRLSQNVQPPVVTVPSTFGQVKPASRLTFCTRSPKRSRKKKLYAKYRSPAARQSSERVGVPVVIDQRTSKRGAIPIESARLCYSGNQ